MRMLDSYLGAAAGGVECLTSRPLGHEAQYAATGRPPAGNPRQQARIGR